MNLFDRVKTMFATKAAAPPASEGQTGKNTAPAKGQTGWAIGTTLFTTGDFPRYNPDDLLVKKGKRIYQRMMMDDQVKAVAEFKRDAVTSRKYHFTKDENESGEGYDKNHEEIEAYFKAMIDSMDESFKDGIDSILTALRFGYSVNEKIYKSFEHDGKTYWGLSKFVLLPFETFDGGFKCKEGTNDIQELNQIIGGRTMTRIPRDKVVLFVHRPDVDPLYGESDLRAVYRPWWSKDVAIKFQNIHLERHAGGFVVGNVTEPNVVANDKALEDLKLVLENISAHTAILAPKGVEIDVKNPIQTTAYERAIAGYDKAIAKAMLMPNLLGLSEQDGVGSYAQSVTQLEVFFWVLDKITTRLEDALNRQVFAELAEMNFGTNDFPKFQFEPLTDSMKREIAKTWGNLVSQGAVIRTETDEEYTRELLDYPKKPDNWQQQAQPQPGAAAAPAAAPEVKKDDEEEEPPPDAENENGKQGATASKADAQKKNQTAAHERHDHEITDEVKSWMKRADFAKIKETIDTTDEAFRQQLSDAMVAIRKSIEEQIAGIAGDKSWGNVNPEQIVMIAIPKQLVSNVRACVRRNLQATFDGQFAIAKDELPRKVTMAKMIRPGMDKDQAERFLSSRAMRIAGVLDRDTLNAVQRIMENGIKYDKSSRQMMQEIDEDTDLAKIFPKYDDLGRAINYPARLETIVRTNTADAMNQARMALFTDPALEGYVQAFQYSAILDDRTTDLCESLDGDIRVDWAELTPPNHFNCRSLLIPVTADDDWDGKQDKLPADAAPADGFYISKDKKKVFLNPNVDEQPRGKGGLWVKSGDVGGQVDLPLKGVKVDVRKAWFDDPHTAESIRETELRALKPTQREAIKVVQEKTKQAQEDFDKAREAFHEAFKEEITPESMQDIDNAIKNSAIVVQMREDAFDDFAQIGEFKTLFQGAISSGANSWDARRAWEFTMFQEAYNGHDIDRPAYGHLDVLGTPFTGATEQYGDIALILKDEVKFRSTISPEDSSSIGRSNFARYLGDPNAVYDSVAKNHDVRQAIIGEYSSGDLHYPDYFETAIHGGVHIPDIKEIVIKNQSDPEKYIKVEAFAKKYGIPVRFDE